MDLINSITLSYGQGGGDEAIQNLKMANEQIKNKNLVDPSTAVKEQSVTDSLKKNGPKMTMSKGEKYFSFVSVRPALD